MGHLQLLSGHDTLRAFKLLENRFSKSSIKLSEQLISNGFPVVEV